MCYVVCKLSLNILCVFRVVRNKGIKKIKVITIIDVPCIIHSISMENALMLYEYVWVYERRTASKQNQKRKQFHYFTHIYRPKYKQLKYTVHRFIRLNFFAKKKKYTLCTDISPFCVPRGKRNEKSTLFDRKNKNEIKPMKRTVR